MSEGRSKEAWSGRVGFILAVIGSAVGIGSIWKFPYEVGANGGAAFVLFYLLGMVLVVVPLMFAELAIGRRGAQPARGDAPACIAALAERHAAGRGWALAGYLGILTGFLILSFYSVIGGWMLAHALDTAWLGLAGPDAGAVQARHDALLAAPGRMLVFHAVFLGVAAIVVGRGIQGGIEAAAKVLMPVLGVLMLLLAIYASSAGDVRATVDFLFRLDPATISAKGALDALGLGFFSIGVGLGLMITYAAYSTAAIDLKEVAIVSVVADTAISLVAGFAVFPIVFAQGLDPASGAGLVFVTLPIAFAQMPFGALAATAFFVLLFVAALASAISMLELVVALLGRYGWRRPIASIVAALACFVAGIATVLSFNRWADWQPTVFEALDFLTSNVMLPVGGLLLAIFAGWVLPIAVLAEELGLRPAAASVLRMLLRYVAPLAIVAATLGGTLG